MKTIRISISELAAICNVSPGTVDRALNNRSGINPQTKEKILKVAKEYGYRPCVGESTDKIKGRIGIIVFNLENEYFSKLIEEVEQILCEANYATTIMLSHYDKQREIECIRSLYNMGVDGIILCPVNSGEEFENYLKLFHIPIITTGNRIGSTAYIGVDDFNAMKEFAGELLQKDYEQIIYFSPAINYETAHAQRLRYEGFMAALEGRDYSVVTDIEDIEESYSPETLIICSTDYYALKVYFKAKNATIAGFDNIDILDKYKIKIHSVGYSLKEIAKDAFEMILQKNVRTKLIDHYTVFR